MDFIGYRRLRVLAHRGDVYVRAGDSATPVAVTDSSVFRRDVLALAKAADKVHVLTGPSQVAAVCWLRDLLGGAVPVLAAPAPRTIFAKEVRPQDAFGFSSQIASWPDGGGWATMTAARWFAHEFTAKVVAHGDDAQADIVTWLEGHPMWRPWAFVGSGDALAAARLLAQIADPYQYVSPSGSLSVERLYTCLCLNRANIGGLRKRHAFRAWYGDGEAAKSSFLWSTAVAASISGLDTELSLLRATRRFVRYLYLLWLDVLRCERLGISGAHFSAQDFFEDSMTAARFTAEFGQPWMLRGVDSVS